MDKNKLKELFKANGKKLKTDVIALFCIGVLFLLTGKTFFSNKGDVEPKENLSIASEKSVDTETHDSYVADLEKRLENILSKVDGVGSVKVMITVVYSEEMILAQEAKEEGNITTETAQQGDSRVIETSKLENKVVLIEDSDGSTKPIVLKQIEPKIEGVLIVSEGGDDILVKDSLSKVAQALLNVPAHKVEVLCMNKN